MPRGAWTKKDERKYEAIFESCRFGSRPRAEKTCKRIAAATVNRDRALRGLAAPEGLQVREIDTGAKNYFRFEAELGGEYVGAIVAAKARVGGRTVYSVRDVDVARAHRRKGIATKLYEAAAQEACRRRARLASIERLYGAHSHDFWAKQKAKGRVQELPGKPVPRDQPADAYTPVYVLDCAFARDLSGPKRRKR